MVLSFFRQSDSPMEEVEQRIHQMLVDGRAVYDVAMSAVFGGGKSKETKQEVKSTDHEINVGQRDVRRALLEADVVHEEVTVGGVVGMKGESQKTVAAGREHP